MRDENRTNAESSDHGQAGVMAWLIKQEYFRENVLKLGHGVLRLNVTHNKRDGGGGPLAAQGL